MIDDPILYYYIVQTTYWIFIAIGLIFAFAAMFLFPSKDERKSLVFALLLALIAIWRIGCLPAQKGYYWDREAYAANFLSASYSEYHFELFSGHDQLLGLINHIFAPFLDLTGYFYVMALLYVGIYFIGTYRMSVVNVVWLFAIIIMSMGFIGYGNNTMRAGLAISFIVLGLSLYNSLPRMLICFALALMTHFSMVIPISMILISKYYNNTRLFFWIWILAIPISFVAGNYFNEIFSSWTEDQRTQYLTTENTGYKQGFRIDFILYSLAPLAVGAYYIFKCKYKSLFYRNIYNAYVLTNAFWILVIRANFTDRFAYLSWFLIPFVLAYPLVKQPHLVRKPNIWMSAILLGETLFKLIY